jgi:hypothetical protein
MTIGRRHGGHYSYIWPNPRPARGPEILSLTQLRHYIGLFWTDRRYGICHIRGGKQAFLRFCGSPLDQQIRMKLLNRESEYFGADLQRQLSRKVLQILRGHIIFVPTSDTEATWKPLMDAPQPPLEGLVPFHDHHFRIEHTAIGPKIRRL